MHLKELVPFVTGPGGTLAAARYGNAFRAAAPRAVPDGSGAAGRKVAGDAEAFRLLVARPAARADLGALCALAGHVNVASMRGGEERNRAYVEQSVRTLAGDLAWEQGLLLLPADLFPPGGGPHEVAGSVRLQAGWGGCWKRCRHDRYFNFPGLRAWAGHEYLTYEPNADGDPALEFAGLTVAPRHQGKKLSRFLAESWALFVLVYQGELRRRMGPVERLYANLLTTDAGGKYPFYERVVRPLFGGLDYDTVDTFRYARCNARSPLLDEFLDARGDKPRACIPCHLLPDDVRRDFGRVGDRAAGCRRSLERLGFRRAERYDVLDGGPYYENTVAGLGRGVARRQCVARRARESAVGPDAPRLTFAPSARPMPEFRCGRARCRVEGDELLLGEEAFDALGMRPHEPVVALAAPPGEGTP
jgi:arginine/ornithine N-succinyltransferase beta subunit